MASAVFNDDSTNGIGTGVGLPLTYNCTDPGPVANPSTDFTAKPTMNSVVIKTTLLLTASNVFMTFAWYAHLRNLSTKAWYVAAFISWGIALCEYLLQVPANRIGYTTLSLAQLKMLQEVIALTVFVPFAVFYMKQPVKLDYLWAGLCLMGALYFMFRGQR